MRYDKGECTTTTPLGRTLILDVQMTQNMVQGQGVHNVGFYASIRRSHQYGEYNMEHGH
jgi:hypothetical protein